MAAGVAHPHDELVIELQDVDLDADGVALAIGLDDGVGDRVGDRHL